MAHRAASMAGVSQRRHRAAVVTGGAGFIGSNLVDALVSDGQEVLVLDDLSTGRAENLTGALRSGATLEQVDIVDAAAVRPLVRSFQPDVVFHLAAQIDVRRSVADPSFDARVNVNGTQSVLAAASEARVRRFVFSSTGGAIYGDADRVPTPEDAPQRPLAPYGANKAAAEGACEEHRRRHGLSTVSLRYANVYGPRQDPLGEGGVVAIFCARALRGAKPTIFGDGRQTRDFVFVDDVVVANLVAAGLDVNGAYNIGTGRETSVNELFEALQRSEGGYGDIEPERAAARPGEVQRSCLDVTRARSALGWTPRTELREGLERTLTAVSEHLGISEPA